MELILCRNYIHEYEIVDYITKLEAQIIKHKEDIEFVEKVIAENKRFKAALTRIANCYDGINSDCAKEALKEGK